MAENESSPEGKRIVTIGGAKFEVDFRHATRIDEFKVGDKIKLLVSDGYTNPTFTSYPAVIIGFDDFKNRPTILIAYLDAKYAGAEIKIYQYNADSKSEIAPLTRDEEVLLDKGHVLENFGKKIEEAEAVVANLKRQKEYFIHKFGVYFKDVAKAFEEKMEGTVAKN